LKELKGLIRQTGGGAVSIKRIAWLPGALLALLAWPANAQDAPAAPAAAETSVLRIFLDCNNCAEDYLRDEIDFVEFVRDRFEGDVHVLITNADTGAGGEENTVSFVGLGRFQGTDHVLRSVTLPGGSADQERRGIATAMRVGLLNYIASGGIRGDMEVEVDLGALQRDAEPLDDPWNYWVFSLSGDASLDGEESNREMQLDASVSADRITQNWKISLGALFEHEKQDFDLDEDEPFSTTQREREFRWLLVKSLGQHWSAGTLGMVRSSSFTNTALEISASPAIEFNLFPYSQYTRRQLRMMYSVGPRSFRYDEETLFGKTRETLTQQEFSITLDQQEEWGEIEARFEASNYFPGFSRNRLELDGEISINVARGLQFDIEGSASRIRDQLSLPRRDATPEEVLLELRQIRSGYEYGFAVGFTYTFGSIFSSIVNPRFGQ
jgi:hypothetical protein